MNSGKTIFTQMMDFLPNTSFASAWNDTTAITRSNVSPVGISFFVWPLLNSPIGRVSEISRLVFVPQPKLYHMGFRGKVSRNTLANANKSRLAHLCRLRPSAHLYRQASLHQRRLRRATGPNRLCPGLHHYRSLPFSVPMGQISKAQRRRQAAYSLGSARKYPDVVFITHGKIHDVNILDSSW